jgi:hypothetical protein
MDRGKKKNILIVLLAIVLVPIVGVLAPVGAFLVWNHFYIKWEESHDIAFDLSLWQVGTRDKVNDSNAVRIRMCHDFIARQSWRGKTKQELTEWLGKSDNFPFYDEWNFNYWVGPQRGPIKVDSAWLCFRFDKNGKATEAKLKQD